MTKQSQLLTFFCRLCFVVGDADLVPAGLFCNVQRLVCTVEDHLPLIVLVILIKCRDSAAYSQVAPFTALVVELQILYRLSQLLGSEHRLGPLLLMDDYDDLFTAPPEYII